MEFINFNAGHNLPDGGLWYAETDPTRFVVEPFNAASAAVFILMAIGWLMALKGKFAERTFLYIATIILLIGAIGGSLYHAFRSSALFIYLDWVPILVLCVMAATYFLFHVTKRIGLSLLLMALMLGLQVLVWNIGNTRGHYNINVNYGLMALTVLLPLTLFMRMKHFRYWGYVAGAIAGFLTALFFRIVDEDLLLPFGTHFLWHLFGAVSCHLMFLYIYRSYQPES